MKIALIIVCIIAAIEWLYITGIIIRFAKTDGEFVWNDLNDEDFGVDAKMRLSRPLEDILSHHYMIIEVKYSSAPITHPEEDNDEQ